MAPATSVSTVETRWAAPETRELFQQMVGRKQSLALRNKEWHKPDHPSLLAEIRIGTAHPPGAPSSFMAWACGQLIGRLSRASSLPASKRSSTLAEIFGLPPLSSVASFRRFIRLGCLEPRLVVNALEGLRRVGSRVSRRSQLKGVPRSQRRVGSAVEVCSLRRCRRGQPAPCPAWVQILLTHR